MDVQKALSHIEFINREYNVSHLSYEREMQFYQSIKMGNAEEALRLFKPLDSKGLGKLSEDSLRNLKYHLVITVAFITRYCIEGGMDMEQAYNLSDIYIRSIDKCREEAEIHMLHREVVEDYAQRMHIIIKKTMYSRPIIMCFDYVYNNLHSRITLEELAQHIGLSSPYLSKLFHKEVGVTVTQYIMRKRIEAAENMLKYSELSSIEISDYLCFSSESHFIHVFKKHIKITPKEYRERFFRSRLGKDQNKTNS